MRAKRILECCVLGLLSVIVLNGCSGGSSPQPPAQATPTSNGLLQGQVQFQQATYPYFVYLPPAYDGVHPLPAILLIHGGGGNGPDFLSIWQGFAQQTGIILVAPTLPLGAQFETIAPQVFQLIMDTARMQWTIDGSRIYLFGYSAGGFSVFDAAMFDSQYFAAAGVFACVITPDFDWIVQKAQRKIPIAIYIGDHDEFFTLAQAEATRDLLLANGFPVHYQELANTDHNYSAVAGTVNPDVWNYFSANPLP